MGERIRAKDWSRTSLGPIETWPQSLVASLGPVLGAEQPMIIAWGPDALVFYNDAYIDVLGRAKHPWALGRPSREVWSDLGELERARRAADLALERLQAALAASAIGTYLWDVQTNEVDHDEGVKRLFGFGSDEGDPIEAFTARIVEEDREAWLAGLAASADEGLDFQQEYRVRLPDGTLRWVLDKGRMIFDEHGNPTHMAGAVVDITEQKRLTQIAQDASRAKDEFLAMLGHELRNPLAPIVTAIELMKMRGDDATKEREIIERQVRHLNRLVDDLLDISRITRGLIELRREPLALGDVIAKGIEIASPMLEEKHHHFSLEVEPGLRVVADPVRLAQVFSNLLTNAARYTPRHGRIRVIGRREDGRVVVRVIDDGIGIEAEMLDRVFDLFVQGGRSAARSEGGLGIGLALVKNLVRLHHGTVAVHSAGRGAGSEFVVSLPEAVSSAVECPRAPAADEVGDRRRVLVVDDNVDATMMLSELIRAMGHEVATAHDGPQALSVVDGFHPDVAILDIGLPAMDGYELAARLRDRGVDCRMIAVTGYGQEQDRARSREAGFAAHLVKPVDFKKLAQLVTEPA